MSPVRRIIVGVSGSPRGLPALRYAADLAHAHGGALFPVHAWAPSALELAGHHYPAVLVQEWEDAAGGTARSAGIAWPTPAAR